AEQVTLLALVGLLARADGSISESELETVAAVRAELQPERFERVRDAAAALDGPPAIFEAAKAVTRTEARSIMYNVLLDMAVPDTISEAEGAMLDRLADLWELESPLDEE
ncbi:MAG TPA: hypothetical protein VGQ57_19315, partial [Polyangiaceae bacterium]|nr:hypothetical protein [Polyangiaceae bacterium]